jgi:predicted RNase H-like HicB family nuclease
MRHYLLALETGDALSDEGLPIAWATCPDLPGAYEEAPTADEALDRLRALAHHIIAEHIVRDDPLDPAVAVIATPPAPRADTLTIAVSDADIEAVRAMPLLMIEQPEP